MDQNITASQPKVLKHVIVYEQLYQLIQDGVYMPGSQLPSEPDLAEQLHVSRMTLRKALALLREDNLVKNIRGKGNFICETPSEFDTPCIETLQHPIYGCSLCKYEHVEFEFRVELPTNSITKALKQKTPAVIITDRWYYSEQKPSAYTLTFLPIECISETGIDLSHPDELKNYLETGVYQAASFSTCQFSYTTTGNFTAFKQISPVNSFILIQESIYGQNHRMLVSNKHYIPINSFEMHLKTCKGN